MIDVAKRELDYSLEVSEAASQKHQEFASHTVKAATITENDKRDSKIKMNQVVRSKKNRLE
jgi:hypothetical protein